MEIYRKGKRELFKFSNEGVETVNRAIPAICFVASDNTKKYYEEIWEVSTPITKKEYDERRREVAIFFNPDSNNQ